MTTPANGLPADLNLLSAQIEESLRESLQLLREAGVEPAAPTPGQEPSRDTLLQQCLALCEEVRTVPLEVVDPVRTVHQFACSGGTLISKCIAAMPNVQLLSEVDPLFFGSRADDDKPKFTPSDMTALLRASTRGSSDALIAKVFQAALQVIHANAVDGGLHLVLRDHAHSHYCRGAEVPDRLSLRALVAQVAPVCSLVTVRHPLDSFASLSRNGWVHFFPADFETYCRRYNQFLDDHVNVPIVRYEDLAADPAATMQRICRALQLPYADDFATLFSVFRISGDSGRSGDEIALRPRRAEASALMPEVSESGAYRLLASRLDYGPDDSVVTSGA
jgi:hypothetical protein